MKVETCVAPGANELGKLTRETVHDMKQMAAGEMLGVTAARDALLSGKGMDALQELIHRYAESYQELQEEERRR